MTNLDNNPKTRENIVKSFQDYWYWYWLIPNFHLFAGAAGRVLKMKRRCFNKITPQHWLPLGVFVTANKDSNNFIDWVWKQRSVSMPFITKPNQFCQIISWLENNARVKPTNNSPLVDHKTLVIYISCVYFCDFRVTYSLEWIGSYHHVLANFISNISPTHVRKNWRALVFIESI